MLDGRGYDTTQLDPPDELPALPEVAEDYDYGPLDYGPEPASEAPRRRHRWLLILWRVTVLCIVVLAARFAFCAAHNIFTPDTTAFMRSNPDGAIHQWVDLDHISRYPIAAIL